MSDSSARRCNPSAGRAAANRWCRRDVLLVATLLLTSCDQKPPRQVMDALPGAEPMPATTSAALADALQLYAPRERVRTRHLHEDGSPRYTNRLLLEPSPYLRQHAHNPVNWYPWGDEAFEAARRLGRPVLLSIGYSTCHWCHVMEEESFEDDEIARYLNEHYVAIKVDREQRPDLDSIYMTAVQSIAGRGGWPMTVWLTADREPFYGGTYFPPRDGDRSGRRAFLPLLARLADVYRNDAQGVSRTATELAARVRQTLAGGSGPGPDANEAKVTGDAVFDVALTAALARFDAEHGGTRGAPKFPSALPLRALLRHHRRSGNVTALAIVTKTLEGMEHGGIHDHLGGGFHRYSVDSAWGVPHFEKMLYDNALLTSTYVEAWQATGRKEFADAARDILAWVEREMTSRDGVFFAATDADSAGPRGELTEGRFFTWTPAEVEAVVGPPAAQLFNAAYGVRPAGNVDGRSVLHVAAVVDELARESSRTVADVKQSLEQSRSLLQVAREQRPKPLRDDKIVTAWNALMISAAAQASLAFGNDHYRELGARAADVLLRDFAKNGRLVRSALYGQQQDEAFLDDYVFLEAALLDLYEAGDGERRLEQAIALDSVVERDFEDPTGGFFIAPASRTDLLVREKPLVDGAEPSGNSIEALNLIRLGELAGEQRYRDRAERTLGAFAGAFAASPLSVGDALVALDFANDTPKEIVLVTATRRPSLAPLLRVLGSAFVPNRVVVTISADHPASSRLPLAEGKIAIGGEPTAYVCEGRICDRPTSDPAVLAAQLARARPLHFTNTTP
ncbi:MAG: thioredoxin domain-containing protein [Deltaproteobacteria bacterium]|nr:thioredoxin domain-containing protein [Deltaproteobacteria bacterium]